MNRHFIGIDIQVSKKCCYAVIDDTGKLIDSGWFSNTDAEAVGLIKNLIDTPSQVGVGIDAPRRPLNFKCQWYWNKSTRQWKKRKTQKGYGRHSEVILSAHH